MSGTNTQQFIRAAVAGDPGAQFEVAMALAQSGDHAQAVSWMAKAADAGLALAEAQLGLWQVMGAVAPSSPSEGLQRIRTAASAGDDTACLLMAGLAAMGTLTPLDWNEARHWLIESARLGNPRALTQLSLLLPEDYAGRSAFAAHAAAAGYAPAQGLFPGTADGDLDFDRATSVLDFAALAAAPECERLCDAPRIVSARNFIPPAWCHYMRALALPTLLPSDVHNAALGKVVLGVRTSEHMAFGAANSDPLIALVAHRIAALTATPTAFAEETNVLRYRPGQEYRRHVDFFDPDVPAIWAEGARGGQRTATAIVWLNDDYEGGETDFPLAGQRLRGRVGDALAFWNVTPDGRPDRLTVHAGLPVRSGEKWIITKWIRDRPQNP